MWYGKKSVYQEKLKDPMGIFFTKEEFPALEMARDDVSGVLQEAIDKLVEEQSYGILYIPEGVYPMKTTVKIPPSVRLIGYGRKRPLFVLPAHTPGFDRMNYLFWFIGERDTRKEEPKDANAGTFYDAISNIDFKLEEGNPGAVCIRAHFAQHGFISHCHFDLTGGLAGLYEVGNEMEDLTFVGGVYGIMCRMTSPGWPFALLDSVFDGQQKCAILSSRTGFTAFRVRIANTPKAFDLYHPGDWEKLYLEDCLFRNISEEAITCYQAEGVIQQINIRRLGCEKVPILIRRVESGETVKAEYPVYEVEDYSYGYMLEDTEDICNPQQAASHGERLVLHPLQQLPDELASDIPAIPTMETWVSVMQYGAKGDGVTDDTKALQEALNHEKTLYFPQGIYKLTDTLYVPRDRYLYGLSPITTQLKIEDDTPAFAGFGTPKPMLETAVGGFLYMNGIGVETSGKNPRAVGVKWMAGENSYMNDVKFLGGHGNMFRDGRNAYEYLYNETRTADYYPERVWDFQYSSLWITNGGGGIFKDIWSASPYAEAGIAITNTCTTGRMYAISLEHHVRNELKLNRAKNWSFYAFQTEEEKAEGLECLPIELNTCENIMFANLFLFRTVAVDRPCETGIKLWDCKNIRLFNVHNKAQMQYIFSLTMKDETTGFYAKSPEYAGLIYHGDRQEKLQKTRVLCGDTEYEVLANGFLFAQGATLDEDGNLYWCDKAFNRIFQYDVHRELVKPVCDIHFTPSALAADSAGNLLVAVDYAALKTPGSGQSQVDFDPESYHPFFSWFSRRGEKAYAISPKDPYNTMVELKKTPAEECHPETVYRTAELSYEGLLREIVEKPIRSYYPAPDGRTALEGCIDLGRSLLLTPAVAGKAYTIVDNSFRRIYSFEVTEGGNLTNGRIVGAKGQYGAVANEDGTFLTVDDMLYGFRDGEVVLRKPVPQDAHTVLKNGNNIYLVGRNAIYRMVTE